MANNLSTQMLTMFAKGELHATAVQALAHSAARDGWGTGDPLATRLKAAGSSGSVKGHVHRDVVRAARAAGLMSSTAQPYEMTLSDGTSVQLFLPHELMFHLVKDGGMEHLCLTEAELHSHDGPGKLLREWASNMDVQFAGDLSSVCILGMHCDGVPYASGMRAGASKSIFVCSLNVFSGQTEQIRRKRQVLFTLQKAKVCGCGCSGFHTFQELFGVLSWSFRHMVHGVSPSCRHDGSPWTAADRRARIGANIALPTAAILQVRGDWEFFQVAFRFRSVSSDEFCWLCHCTQSPGPLCAWCFTPDAGHRSTLVTHQSYLEACLAHGDQPSELFNTPGFTIAHVAIDTMHSGDLGVFQDAVGSLLWIEVSNRQWHGSRAKGVSALHELLRDFYAAHHELGLSKVFPTINQIIGKEPGYPYLKAKAAETRHLTEFCRTLASMHRHGGAGRPAFAFKTTHYMAGREAEHLAHLEAMFQGLSGYHRSCTAEPFVASDCKAAMYLFLCSFHALHVLWRRGCPASEEKRCPFHLRPKAHMLQHLVEEQLNLWGSPVRSWCYRDEDFVGAVKTIASKSKHPATLELRLNEKLMLLAGLHSSV